MIPIQTAGPPEGVGQALREPVWYMRDGTLQLPALPPLSLYVHLPWCLKKCPYCDFNSHELATADLPEQAYIDALFADLEAALPLIWGRTVHSVFFGGGTPSLFSPQGLERIISGLRARLRLEPGCEVTLEANPGTFECQRFAAFAQAGITRLSVGVQSFDDTALQALGRVHDSAQARAAVDEASRSFATFNLDLMYALPGQDLAALQRDLQAALSYAPPHLSIYHLTVEPNTYFAKYPPAQPDDDLASDMLDAIVDMMAQVGLQRYEVSAFARAGHACRHNLNYWEFGDYLGLGAGAHSKLSFAHHVVRQVRLREPRLYMLGALAGRALAQEQSIARGDLPFEFMLNALRLKNGFRLDDFAERTGLPASAIRAGLAEASAKGWLLQDNTPAGAWVTPTRLGFDFLNDLQALFLPASKA
jgi:putative oxygen-independent coproporphyrinogen III oxidase